MPFHITLITLGVADLERAIAYYRDLGLPFRERDPDDEIAFFTRQAPGSHCIPATSSPRTRLSRRRETGLLVTR